MTSSTPLLTLLEYHLTKNPKTSITDAAINKKLILQDLNFHAQRLGQKLISCRLQEKSIVHFIGPNSLPLIAVYCGILYNKWVPVGSNYTAPLAELIRNINETDSEGLAISRDLWNKFGPSIKCPKLKVVFIYELTDVEEFSIDIEHVEYDGEEVIKENLDNVDWMYMTSGSTGTPKAIMIDHKSIFGLYSQMNMMRLSLPAPLMFITCQPFCNIGGSFAFWSCMYNSASYVIIEAFNEKVYLDCYKNYQCNYLVGTSAILNSLSKYPKLDEYNFATTFGIEVVGSKPDDNVIRILKKRTGISDKALVKTSYCSSESFTSHYFICPISNIPDRYPKAIENVKCKIINPETGTDLKANEIGEICINSPYLMRGYYKDKAKTNSVLSKDGWYRMGDLGSLDEEDRLLVVGRLKEVVKYRGFSVHTLELESILQNHDAVSLCAVIGESHDEHEEIPVAFVVKKYDVKEDELLDFVNEKVTDYKRLHKIYFLQQMPLNNGMKLNKPALKSIVSRNCVKSN